MEISRAVAFACFTVTKWLMIVLAVLFAALSIQAYFVEISRDPVSLFLLFSVGAFCLAGLMHWLAARISN